MSLDYFVAQKQKRKREEEKVAKEAKLADLKIFNQRQKAAVEVAKNAQIVPVLPPSPVAAVAQDIGIPERSDFKWRFKIGDSVFTDPDTRPRQSLSQQNLDSSLVTLLKPDQIRNLV